MRGEPRDWRPAAARRRNTLLSSEQVCFGSSPLQKLCADVQVPREMLCTTRSSLSKSATGHSYGCSVVELPGLVSIQEAMVLLDLYARYTRGVGCAVCGLKLAWIPPPLSLFRKVFTARGGSDQFHIEDKAWLFLPLYVTTSGSTRPAGARVVQRPHSERDASRRRRQNGRVCRFAASLSSNFRAYAAWAGRRSTNDDVMHRPCLP
ncbi:hypothetical protein ISCGN_031459 [Ixodes scapularis]